MFIWLNLIIMLQAILNDPFLGKRAEEGNFTTVPLRDEFLENARIFIFETFCRIHQRIDMGYVPDIVSRTTKVMPQKSRLSPIRHILTHTKPSVFYGFLYCEYNEPPNLNA